MLNIKVSKDYDFIFDAKHLQYFEKKLKRKSREIRVLDIFSHKNIRLIELKYKFPDFEALLQFKATLEIAQNI